MENTSKFDWTKITEPIGGGANPYGMYNKPLSKYNKITEEDLKELKNSQKQKIVLTQAFAGYKVADVLDVKVFPNRFQSEPPSFLVIDEKLGSPKYGIGGRGSVPFYKAYKDVANSNTDVAPQSFIQKHKNHLLIAGALVLGYFAYKKFNK